MSYLVVIEKGKGNFCAYVPDLPGCVATGKTRAAVRKAIRGAISMHLEGMRQDGLPVPAPQASAEVVEVA
jgi:predicted RNase H-like HicB family nuclease